MYFRQNLLPVSGAPSCGALEAFSIRVWRSSPRKYASKKFFEILRDSAPEAPEDRCYAVMLGFANVSIVLRFILFLEPREIHLLTCPLLYPSVLFQDEECL